MCRSLIGLDLSNNSLCNDGISILKEGLLLCKTLKYLNLSATNISCEGITFLCLTLSNVNLLLGAIAIAEVIADNHKLAIVDLSDNSIRTAGLMAICLSMKHNTSVVDFKISQFFESDEGKSGGEGGQTFESLLQELNGYCTLNKSTAIFDESYDLLKSVLIYNRFETESNV